MVKRWREVLRAWCVVAVPMAACGVGAPALGALPPPPPGVQTIERYGQEFSVVGSPGNPNYSSMHDFRQLGGVDSTFAISRTETTLQEWVPFLNALRPHLTGVPSVALAGTYFGLTLDANGKFRAVQGYERSAVFVSFYAAAAYCNWLSNDKRGAANDLFTGVYDLRGVDITTEAGDIDESIQPASGAAFRLPTRNEWIKGMYWDPNRHGEALGGYWLYPTRSDSVPSVGGPGTDAETNAGLGPFFNGMWIPVASYPLARSPWGLLDGSGGVPEWTGDAETGGRWALGTGWDGPPELDRIQANMGIATASPVGLGIRLVAQVPSPSVAALFLPLPCLYFRRSRCSRFVAP
ncbi:MAG: SUMF1/EgtB/PvdO family nonheme iron enzyme [Phycisphaerales bacterium]